MNSPEIMQKDSVARRRGAPAADSTRAPAEIVEELYLGHPVAISSQAERAQMLKAFEGRDSRSDARGKRAVGTDQLARVF